MRTGLRILLFPFLLLVFAAVFVAAFNSGRPDIVFEDMTIPAKPITHMPMRGDNPQLGPVIAPAYRGR